MNDEKKDLTPEQAAAEAPAPEEKEAAPAPQTGADADVRPEGADAPKSIIAGIEYCFLVPANRIGFIENGGPFTLMQLKVIQEVISLVVFCVIANILFQGQQLQWNHLAALVCLVLAVY